jgi:hypothetical protein
MDLSNATTPDFPPGTQSPDPDAIVRVTADGFVPALSLVPMSHTSKPLVVVEFQWETDGATVELGALGEHPESGFSSGSLSTGAARRVNFSGKLGRLFQWTYSSPELQAEGVIRAEFPPLT